MKTRKPWKISAFALTAVLLVLIGLSPSAQESTTPRDEFLDALWVGGSGDLFKLALEDGAPFSSTPLDGGVLAVAVDAEGSKIWAFDEGENLTALSFRGEVMVSLPFAGEWSDGESVYLTAGSDQVWLGFEDVVYQLDGAGLVIHTFPITQGLRGLAYDGTAEKFWAANLREVTGYDLAGQVSDQIDLGNRARIEGIAADPFGGFWLALADGVRRYSTDLDLISDTSLGKVAAVDADHLGGAWVALQKSVARLASDGSVTFETDLPNGGGSVVLRRIAGDPREPGAWALSNSFLFQVGDDGTLRQRLSLNDLAPELTGRDLAVYADLFAPEIVIVAPAAGTLTNDPAPSLVLAWSDLGIGVDSTSLEVTANGDPVSVTCSEVSESGATCGFDSRLPEGPVTLAATVADFFATRSEEATAEITVDTIAPPIPDTARITVEILAGDRVRLLGAAGAVEGGAEVAITNTNSGAAAGVTADAAGSFTVEIAAVGGDVLTLTATDAAGNSSPAATVVVTGDLDLLPPGDFTVAVGSDLSLSLEVEGGAVGPLSFTVTPLPLPEDARLDSTTGVFTYRPALVDVGTLNLTFSVTDGTTSDSETATVTVTGKVPGTPTSIRGRVLDTNDAVDGIDTPIVGTRVSFLGVSATTFTDAEGFFELSNLPFGDQVIDFDSSSAQPAPDGSPYAGFREKIVLVEGVANVIGRPFFLPRIDTDSLTTVDPSTTTVVNNPNLGVSLTIPPNTARNANGTLFTGEISVSEVPAALAPVALPEELEPGLLLTVQPVGITFSSPVPLTMPNFDDLAPGNETDLWSVNPATGLFEIVGVGLVAADGSTVDTISGGIRAASWHSLLPPQPGSDGDDNNDDNQDPDKCDDCSSGSQTALLSGNLAVVHEVVPYYSMNRPRSLRLIYNSQQADPRPTLTSTTTVSRRAAVPPRVSAGLEVGGVDLGPQLVTDTSGLSESRDEPLRQVVQLDGNDLASGLYRYRMKLSSQYSRSTISSFQSGRLIVNNRRDSPVGAGWGIDGLERILPQSDGSVLLSGEDGSSKVFQPAPIDLRSWTREGPPANGSWNVAGDGLSVLQTINGNPTFFVSPNNLIDTVIRGRFRVETSSDDDYVGFVIGYRSPLATEGDEVNTYDFLLFDWKQRDQTAFGGYLARQGFALSRVNGRVTDYGPGFWGHQDSTGFQVLATDFGAGKGWQDLTEHDFELFYFRDRFRVAIDGRTIFDLPGTYPSGRFGFYNFSQSNVRYRSFTAAANFVSPPGDFSSLIKEEDGSYTRTFRDGTVHRFDAAGRKVATVDTSGDATTFTYDAAGRLLSVTDPVGLVTALAYSGDHLASITDPAGRVTRFEYDAGNLVRIIDPDATERSFTYDSRHHLVSQISKRGFETRYDYDFAGRNVRVVRPDSSVRQVFAKQSVGLFDATTFKLGAKTTPAPVVRPEEAVARYVDGNGNVTVFDTDRFGGSVRTVDPRGRVTTATRNVDGNPTRITNSNGSRHDLTYDGRGNIVRFSQTGGGGEGTQEIAFEYEPVLNRVTSITDPMGHRMTVDYDLAGNPVRIEDALGGVSTATYNARGQTATSTDPNGNTIRFGYDAAGNTQTITDPLGVVTRIHRDAVGRVVEIIEAEGLPEERITRFTYDLQNRLLTSTDPTGGTTRYVLDAAGNAVEIHAATGELVSASFDSHNRLLEQSHPVRGFTRYAYDANGNVVERIDSKGARTVMEYDSDNRLVRTIDALGGEQRFTYDLRGNLLSYRNPLDQEWAAVYDRFDRVVSQSDPLGRTSTFAWDGRNYLVSATNPRGQALDFTYDALGRLLSTSTPDNLVARAYDPAGNVISVEDDDSRLLFEHDSLSRVFRTEVVDVGVQPGVVMTASYDALGNRVGLTDTLGGQTTFAYDANSRLTRVVTPAGETVDMAYDASGRFTDILLPNGIATELDYDGNGRLSQLEYRTGTGATLSSFTYLYDVLGKLVTIAEGARVREYSYDALERLTAGGTAGVPESYTYDALGNRIESLMSSTYRYDGVNQLLEDDTYTYAYDAEGNRVSRTEKASGAVTTYAYDAEGQLVQVDLPGGAVTRYRYDGLGRRIEKDVNGDVRRYVYDHASIHLELDGANALTARYSHGPGTDRPLVMERGGASYYYLADHQGSVRFLIDGAGTQVNAYEYDSFGRGLVRSESVESPYGFTGREYDAESGLYYYRARYYDPEIGRFLRQDPLGLGGGGSNFYAYAGNDPVNNRDPSGLLFWDLVDVGFFLWSLHDFIECPSLATGLGLALDTVSLLPVVPSLGWANRADDVLDAVNHADDVADVLRHGDEIGDIANHADEAGDLLRQGDNVNVPCRCFAEDTGVLTEDGEEAIQEIRVGDRLRTRTENGDEQLAEVIGVFEREVDELLLLDVGDAVLKATATHRFWVPGEGWTDAGELVAGNRLLRGDGEEVAIRDITRERGLFTVYDLEVDDVHTFLVSESGFWVHNCNTLEPGPHAGDSIPARGPERDFTQPERDAINDIGRDTGCHTCGTTDPGTRSGDFIPDHQPANALNPDGSPQQLYPHCLTCSRRQGGQVRQATRNSGGG